MTNALSKTFAIILACLLLYVVPTYFSYLRQDDVTYLVARQATFTFADTVRNLGYISPAMYQRFESELLASGGDYAVEMVHSRKRYDPVYDDAGNFTGRVVVNYDEFVTQDIMRVLFPDNSWPPDDPRRFYFLSVGDFFHVKVSRVGKSNATVLWELLSGSNAGAGPDFVIPYGGMVYNEDY